MSFPIFFVIPAPLCHSLEGGNLSFFSVSVGVEFIRPVFSFCRGQIYLTRPYCELNESSPYSFTVTIICHSWIPTAVYPHENGGMNYRKGTGIKEGKSPVEITLGSNTEITPELIRGYFYSNIKFI